MKPSHNSLSLFLKISLLFFLLVMVILLPSGILVLNQLHKTLYEGMEKRGEVLANYFAAGARIPLLTGDMLTLNLLIKEVDTDKDVSYAFVTDSTEQTVAHGGLIHAEKMVRRSAVAAGTTRRHGTIAYRLEGPGGRSFLNITEPITYGSKVIGAFHLGLPMEAMQKQLDRKTSMLMSGSLIYGLPGFFLGLMVILFFCNRFTGQVAELVSAMNEVESGNPGFQIHRIPRSPMGEMVSTFNRLSLRARSILEKDKTEMLTSLPESSREAEFQYPELLPTQIIRNQITVLFAGVKGFKEYADKKAPEEVLVDLNEYFAIAARVSAEYGGQVDKFIGDAVSCVFVSTPMELDHRERAVKAAVALQEALVNSKHPGNDLLTKIGIGISSGVALSGPVDAVSNNIHTFIGENFKTAYSLNVLAGPGEIIVSNEVYQAIEKTTAVEPIPPRELMDRTEAWENFRLKGLLPIEENESPSP